MSIPMTLINL